MPAEQVRSITPPAGPRPAQLGIVAVRRVIFGHLSATLADLAQRRFLHIEEIPDGDEQDGLLIDRRSAPGSRLARSNSSRAIA